MEIKNKRVLKNGAIAGYVYFPKDKKWKWRIVGKQMKGGNNINVGNTVHSNKNRNVLYVIEEISLKDGKHMYHARRIDNPKIVKVFKGKKKLVKVPVFNRKPKKKSSAAVAARKPNENNNSGVFQRKKISLEDFIKTDESMKRFRRQINFYKNILAETSFRGRNSLNVRIMRKLGLYNINNRDRKEYYYNKGEYFPPSVITDPMFISFVKILILCTHNNYYLFRHESIDYSDKVRVYSDKIDEILEVLLNFSRHEKFGKVVLVDDLNLKGARFDQREVYRAFPNDLIIHVNGGNRETNKAHNEENNVILLKKSSNVFEVFMVNMGLKSIRPNGSVYLKNEFDDITIVILALLLSMINKEYIILSRDYYSWFSNRRENIVGSCLNGIMSMPNFGNVRDINVADIVKNTIINVSNREVARGGNKYINIKNHGKRLVRYTKTGKKYVIVNGKKKYI
jgi:hypothetical protein